MYPNLSAIIRTMSWRTPETGIKPTLKSRAAEFIYHHLNDKYELKISDRSAHNMSEANKILSDSALVVYINHIFSRDAKIMIPLVLTLPNVRSVMGPVGMKHYDFSRDPVNAVFFRSLRVFGIHAAPVVQNSDVYQYGQEQKQGMIINLKQYTSDLLNRAGTLYGIAPEGTRNPSGQLQRANRGIGYLESYVQPDQHLHYLPVGLVYPEHDTNPRIIVSEPFTLSDILPAEVNFASDPKEHAQQISDVLMTVLARSLPEHMRGVYGNPETILDPLGIRENQLHYPLHE